MTMPRSPVIAIVGRPNVGKSSLLNALTGKRISIVQDMPGVTRDRVSTPWQLAGKWTELVDTGGYGFDDSQGLTEHIRHQIELAMARADLVLFLVDATAGLTGGDEEIATLLRRMSAKVLLVANKADNDKLAAGAGDFARLGFGTPLAVSAKNRRQLDALADLVAKQLDLSDAPTDLPAPQMYVAIVGKRNAGKSTLVNAIARLYEDDAAPGGAAEPERVIVSEVPGTTRDSVDVRFEKDGKTLVVIDTAGVRKKRHMVTNDIEFYSFHRAQRSVRRADVVLLLIDAAEPVSEPDKKLAAYVLEQQKPVVVVVNKWDIARETLKARQKPGARAPRDEDLMEKYGEYLDAHLRHLSYAPVAFVTARDGKNVQAVLDLCQHLFKQANQRLTTGRLNAALKQALTERAPATKRGQRPKVYYATQVGVAPPTIVLKVNHAENFPEQYQRYLVNRLRELLPYPEVPIRLLVRDKEQSARFDRQPSLEERREQELIEDETATASEPAGARSARPERTRRKARARGRK